MRACLRVCVCVCACMRACVWCGVGGWVGGGGARVWVVGGPRVWTIVEARVCEEVGGWGACLPGLATYVEVLATTGDEDRMQGAGGEARGGGREFIGEKNDMWPREKGNLWPRGKGNYVNCGPGERVIFSLLVAP